MIPFSVLDLSPITDGGSATAALHNTLDLARHAERLGFNRFWLTEHHNMAGIASAATSVVIAHVAAGTSTIRLGAGGVMLPNHAPLIIAEQFGTLAALHPGRIELGLGRAPGTDPLTARALRRNLNGDVDSFPHDVVELMGYFGSAGLQRPVRAIPGAGLDVPVWILGSSLYGAQLAAVLGLPYAFASHFAPGQMIEAIEVYRSTFRPSPQLDRPYVMLGFNVFAADSDEEAHFRASSMQQAFLNLRRGNPGPLPAPQENFLESLVPSDRAMLNGIMSASAIGNADTVRAAMDAFITRTGADELIVTSQIFDHNARLRSYEIVADAHRALTEEKGLAPAL